MANILTTFLILAVVLKVVDLSSLVWLDYVIFALIIGNIGLSVAKYLKERK